MPVIALSPATVAEAYELTYRAFNFAEQYRTPVFLLTSKEIGVTRESVDLESVKLPPLIERERLPAGQDVYLPHDFDTLEATPRISDFGGDHVARYTTSTHDRRGYLTTKPEVIQEMIDHYIAKIDGAADDLTLVKADLQPGAEILVISYGIISRSAAVAVRAARAAGKQVSSLVLQTLWPLPQKAIMKALEGIKKVVVPELNMGQYVLEIERLVPPGVEVVGVGKMDTTLLSPTEIAERGGLL